MAVRCTGSSSSRFAVLLIPATTASAADARARWSRSARSRTPSATAATPPTWASSGSTSTRLRGVDHVRAGREPAARLGLALRDGRRPRLQRPRPPGGRAPDRLRDDRRGARPAPRSRLEDRVRQPLRQRRRHHRHVRAQGRLRRGHGACRSPVAPSPATPSPASPTSRSSWLRDGRAIKGADKRTYKLRRADAGHRIACRTALRDLGRGPRSAQVGPADLPHPHPLRMVADRHPRDLLHRPVGDHRDGVRAGHRDEAVLAVAAVGRPVRLLADVDELVARTTCATRSPRSRPSCPPRTAARRSGSSSARGGRSRARTARGVAVVRFGQVREPRHAVLDQVVLDEPVEERDLEVDEPSRPGRRSSAGPRSSCPDSRPRPASCPCRAAAAPAASSRRRSRTTGRPSWRPAAGRRWA